MTYQIPISRISLKHIELDDQTYSLLPFEDETMDTDFITHITRCGVLHPPIIKENNQGGYLVVAGRKRLQVVNEHLELTACDCLVLPENTHHVDTMALALDESLIQSPLSCIEKATFFSKILPSISEQEAANRFLPFMNMKAHPYHITKLLQLTALEEPMARAVHFGDVSEKAAFELSSLSFRDRLALFDLISTLKLSVGNQRNIISICQDLAKRENASILTIVNNKEMHDILHHPVANTPQKTSKLMKYLQEKHSPRFAAELSKFSAFSSRLNLPKWVDIGHSKSFESNQFSLTINVSSFEELESYWKYISSIEDLPPNKTNSQQQKNQ